MGGIGNLLEGLYLMTEPTEPTHDCPANALLDVPLTSYKRGFNKSGTQRWCCRACGKKWSIGGRGRKRQGVSLRSSTERSWDAKAKARYGELLEE
jgi:transposase-like protein